VKDLTNDPLLQLAQSAPLRKYPKGQILFYEGDSPSNVYILKSGAIKIYDIDDKGNERIVHVISPPSLFPAVLFFSQSEASNTFYSTLSECEVYVISAAMVREKLEQDNSFALYCLRWFAEDTREVMIRMASLEKSDAREKLLVALRFLAFMHGEPTKNEGWRRVNFSVSHQLLADMIGVTRESTTLAMKDLQKEAIVAHPKITVLDVNTIKLSDLLGD
jgi:CRP/FNR family cyclic AMP-dependent transcriptional regulator